MPKGKKPKLVPEKATGKMVHQKPGPAGKVTPVEMSLMRPDEVKDIVDLEIDAALGEGRLVDMEKAFPRAPGAADPSEDGEDTPTKMAQRIANTAPSYKTEYRLRLFHRLFMRGLPMDLIASQLGVSVRRAQQLRQMLNKRLRYEALHMDVPRMAGDTKAFYDEVRSVALRFWSDTGKGDSHRLTALNVAMQAETNKQRFLVAAGIYDVARMQPTDLDADDPHKASQDLVMQMAEAIIDDKGGDKKIAELIDDEDIEDSFEEVQLI